MDVMHEIVLPDEKFAGVAALRDFLGEINAVKYCAFGSFLSSVLFTQQFSSSFDLLVLDEMELAEQVRGVYKIDTRHGTVVLDETNGAEPGSTLKIRLVDASAKNSALRDFLIEHSEMRTCAVVNSEGHVEKFDIPIPRRGPTLILALTELDDSPASIASVVEKIVWSLSHVGVAPLLRESRFVPSDSIEKAASVIEDLCVTHANKTVSLLHTHAADEAKSITAAELKRLGRPYAALLRA